MQNTPQKTCKGTVDISVWTKTLVALLLYNFITGFVFHFSANPPAAAHLPSTSPLPWYASLSKPFITLHMLLGIVLFTNIYWYRRFIVYLEIRRRRRNYRIQWEKLRFRSLFSIFLSVKAVTVSPELLRFDSIRTLLLFSVINLIRFNVAIFQVLEQLSGQTPVFSKGNCSILIFLATTCDWFLWMMEEIAFVVPLIIYCCQCRVWIFMNSYIGSAWMI